MAEDMEVDMSFSDVIMDVDESLNETAINRLLDETQIITTPAATSIDQHFDAILNKCDNVAVKKINLAENAAENLNVIPESTSNTNEMDNTMNVTVDNELTEPLLATVINGAANVYSFNTENLQQPSSTSDVTIISAKEVESENTLNATFAAEIAERISKTFDTTIVLNEVEDDKQLDASIVVAFGEQLPEALHSTMLANAVEIGIENVENALNTTGGTENGEQISEILDPILANEVKNDNQLNGTFNVEKIDQSSSASDASTIVTVIDVKSENTLNATFGMENGEHLSETRDAIILCDEVKNVNKTNGESDANSIKQSSSSMAGESTIVNIIDVKCGNALNATFGTESGDLKKQDKLNGTFVAEKIEQPTNISDASTLVNVMDVESENTLNATFVPENGEQISKNFETSILVIGVPNDLSTIFESKDKETKISQSFNVSEIPNQHSETMEASCTEILERTVVANNLNVAFEMEKTEQNNLNPTFDKPAGEENITTLDYVEQSAIECTSNTCKLINVTPTRENVTPGNQELKVLNVQNATNLVKGNDDYLISFDRSILCVDNAGTDNTVFSPNVRTLLDSSINISPCFDYMQASSASTLETLVKIPEDDALEQLDKFVKESDENKENIQNQGSEIRAKHDEKETNRLRPQKEEQQHLKDMMDADSEEKMNLIQELNRFKLELNQVKQENTTLVLQLQKKEEIYLKGEADFQQKEAQYKIDNTQLLDKIEKLVALTAENNNDELHRGQQQLTEKAQKLEDELKKKKEEVSHYKKIMNEYESTLSAKNCENEKLKMEHGTVSKHLAALEVAFSDVIAKYDRSKDIIAGFQRNQQTLNEALEKSQQIAVKYEERYETLKTHAKGQLDRANGDIINLKEKHATEINKMSTLLKRLQIKTASLQQTLDQKVAECTALASLCDEMTETVPLQ